VDYTPETLKELIPWREWRNISICSGCDRTHGEVNLSGHSRSCKKGELDAHASAWQARETELIEACQNALGAYDALKTIGADKHLPGYESCLSFLRAAIAEGGRMTCHDPINDAPVTVDTTYTVRIGPYTHKVNKTTGRHEVVAKLPLEKSKQWYLDETGNHHYPAGDLKHPPSK